MGKEFAKPSLLTINNSKGEILLDIPLKKDSEGGARLDYTPEELFELIAEQTRGYWGEKFAQEIEALGGYDFMNLRKTLIDRDAVLNLVRGKE